MYTRIHSIKILDNCVNLKKDLRDYENHSLEHMWMVNFKKFLSEDIINSADKEKIIELACQSWTGKSKEECLSGAASFYTAVLGLRNTIELTQSHCQFNPDLEKTCSYYQEFLNENISQLKFILKIQ